MPLYTFACESCGAEFDELQSFDAPPPPCPACASALTKRQIAAFQAGSGRREASTFTPATTRRDPYPHHHH